MPNSQLILVADDEPVVLRFAEAVLARRGYQVLAADNGQEAWDLYEKNPDLDLVITDVVMPGTTGPQLVRKIHQKDPQVRCVFMSGYSHDQVRQHGADPTDCRFLPKPFTPDSLIRTVEGVLSKS